MRDFLVCFESNQDEYTFVSFTRRRWAYSSYKNSDLPLSLIIRVNMALLCIIGLLYVIQNANIDNDITLCYSRCTFLQENLMMLSAIVAVQQIEGYFYGNIDGQMEQLLNAWGAVDKVNVQHVTLQGDCTVVF